MHICGGPELFLLRVLKVVLDDGAAKETPSDLVVLPLIIQKGLLTNNIRTADLLDKCVEVGDGVLDGGKGEEGDQVSTVGCHCHDDKQPPEAGEDPSGVRISSYNDLMINDSRTPSTHLILCLCLTHCRLLEQLWTLVASGFQSR